jgi:hypothetical protein
MSENENPKIFAIVRGLLVASIQSCMQLLADIICGVQTDLNSSTLNLLLSVAFVPYNIYPTTFCLKI